MNREAVRAALRQPWLDLRAQRDALASGGLTEHAQQIGAAMALVQGVADALKMAPETAAVLEAFPGAKLVDTVTRQ